MNLKVVFLAILVRYLNEVHSESRGWENYRINTVHGISEVPPQNPNDEENEFEFCGWETELEVRRACQDILQANVFKFNKIYFAKDTSAQPMKKYAVKKSRLWHGKNAWLCKCPTTRIEVYLSDVTSDVGIVDLYVNQGDFISEKKMQKLKSKKVHFWNKDSGEQTGCERCGTCLCYHAYCLTCCACNNCCNTF